MKRVYVVERDGKPDAMLKRSNSGFLLRNERVVPYVSIEELIEELKRIRDGAVSTQEAIDALTALIAEAEKP